MSTPVDSPVTCWACDQPIVHEGGQWVGQRGCPEAGGHWVGCTQDMGLMTDCGDDAPEVRDGFPLCTLHAANYDTLCYLDAIIATQPTHCAACGADAGDEHREGCAR